MDWATANEGKAGKGIMCCRKHGEPIACRKYDDIA